MLFSSLSAATNFVVSVPCLPIPCKAQKKDRSDESLRSSFVGVLSSHDIRDFGGNLVFDNGHVSIQLLPKQEKSRLHGEGEAVECRPSADKESIAQGKTFVKWFFRSTDTFPGILRMHTPHKAALQTPGTPV